MSAPVTASVPHRLGKAEALRRLKLGLSRAKGQFGSLLTIEHEEWSGDTLRFQMRALGQSARHCSRRTGNCQDGDKAGNEDEDATKVMANALTDHEQDVEASRRCHKRGHRARH